MSRIWRQPVLKDDVDAHRSVGWLELFFDLVFVVIVGVLAANLAHDLSLVGLRDFALQFVAVFWAWNAFTYYSERFESHGIEARVFTFIAIVAVAGLAVWGSDGLGGNYIGFALSYVLARGLNIGMWLRAGYHAPIFRRAAFSFAVGFAVALALILASFAAPADWRPLLWGLAVLVDVISPVISQRTQLALPPISRDKFPERFGLLTMIVLGEVVAGVIGGVARVNDEGHLSPTTVLVAGLGLLLGFGLWWIYYDFIARRPPRMVFALNLAWVYLHLLMLFGMVVVGVAIERATESADALIAPAVATALFGGLGFTLVTVALIEPTLDRDDREPTHRLASPWLKVAVGVAVSLVALVPRLPVPVALGIAVVALAIPATYGTVTWFASSVSDEADVREGP